MSIHKKIAKNAFYNLIIKVIAGVFAFVASVVAARFLGPDKYGVYSLVMWFLSFAGLLVNLGLPTTITKYVSEYWGRKDFSSIRSILKQLLRVELLAGLVVSLLLFFLAPFIANWYHNPDLSLYVKVASLVILPLGLMWIYNGYFCGLQRFDLIAKVNIVVSPLTLGLILLVLYAGGKIEWLVGVSVVSNILLVGSYLYLKKTSLTFSPESPFRHIPVDQNLDPWSKWLKFSASVFVVSLLEAVIWERFGILFLSIFSPSSEIAFYNVAFILSSRTMILLPGALTGILLPAISEVYGEGNKEELARVHANSTRYLAMLSLPLCLGGIAIAKHLFPILYGVSFQPASFVFAILLLGGTVGLISTSSSALLYGVELQKIVVGVEVLSALVNLLASWLLVPPFGAKGAAFATTIAQLVGGLGMIIYAYKRVMKQKFPITFIWRIFSASALMGVVGFFLIDSIKGVTGLAITLIVSLPMYIICLFFTRSFTSDDIVLLESALLRMPSAFGRIIQPAFRWLIQSFYPSR